MEVLSVLRNEDDIQSGYSGDNVKLKLEVVEEEVSCSPLHDIVCKPIDSHTGHLIRICAV